MPPLEDLVEAVEALLAAGLKLDKEPRREQEKSCNQRGPQHSDSLHLEVLVTETSGLTPLGSIRSYDAGQNTRPGGGESSRGLLQDSSGSHTSSTTSAIQDRVFRRHRHRTPPSGHMIHSRRERGHAQTRTESHIDIQRPYVHRSFS